MKRLLVYGIITFVWMLSILFGDVVTTYSKGSGSSDLEEKVRYLIDVTSRKFVTALTTEKFKELAKSGPRNYSFIVMLTALRPYRQCYVCSYVDAEFLIVAKSFRISHGLSSEVFFGSVDYDAAVDVFKILKISSVPVIIHFPASNKRMRASDTMDMQRLGFTAEVIAKWIAERTEIEFKVFRPPSYYIELTVFVIFACCATLIYFRNEYFPFLRNRQIWACVAIIFSSIMTSGQMWNRIRNPPFMHQTPDGENVYIHGSSQGQFVSESYLILILNIAYIGCLITTLEILRNNQTFSRAQRWTLMFCITCAAFIFSAILVIFRAKATSYPYRALL